MPLGDGLVLDQVIKRSVSFSKQVVVCTSVDFSDDAIEEFCKNRGIVCVRGSIDDVFFRYQQALQDPRVISSTWFARVTGDCPLLSTDLAQLIIEQIEADDDYVCVIHDGLPRGLTAEFIKTRTFLAIDRKELEGPAREHVTLHLYENRDQYQCRLIQPPSELAYPTLRMTLDYEEDYALLTALFEDDPDISAEQAVSHLLSSAQLRQLNAHCVQKLARPTN